MTDNNEDLKDVPSIFAQTLLHRAAKEELIDDDLTDDDEVVEMDEEDFEANSEGLMPNDIFGLDPFDVLTLEELADYLKISPAAVRRAIKDEKLPGRNIGGEWRFLRDAVANWLRCQETPVVQQQQAREAYSQPKPKYSSSQEDAQSQYSRPPRRPFQPDQSGQSGQSENREYRPRQRFSEGQFPYGNQSSTYRGGQQGNRTQRDDVPQGEGDAGGYEAHPPRQPFRTYEGRGEGNFQGGAGYSGGYRAGGQQFSGGPKRKNKRQVFDKARGKRMDRRKENGATEGQE